MMQILLTLISLLLFAQTSFALLAFPTAVGMGRDTVGGRGGAVIHVTNLNDSGTGSLRAAITATGARTVVFDVSGIIELDSIINVTNGNITVAGQTSPNGVMIYGHQITWNASQMIIRHLRFRTGYEKYDVNDDYGDSFAIWGEPWGANQLVKNVIVDHVSAEYGVDETFSISGGVQDATIQYCLAAKGLNNGKGYYGGLYPHSKGMMFSGKYHHDTNVSAYRNFIASSTDRMPNFYNETDDYNTQVVDFVNNVSYNWHHGYYPYIHDDGHANVINNYMRPGPNSNSTNNNFVMTVLENNAVPDDPYELVYVSGNCNPTGCSPDWRVASGFTTNTLSTSFQKSTAYSVSVALTHDTMTSTLADTIVSEAGATKCQRGDCRDSLDTTVASEYTNNNGTIPELAEYPDDYPTYSTTGDNPTDTDSDGMPDAWETANGTSTTVANNNSHTFDDDYTDIEYYINTLAGDYENSGSGSGSPLGGNSHLNNIGTGLSTAHLRTE